MSIRMGRMRVLLDEPTSSVDPKTELKIYANLFREFQDKVVVSALHRLHLLPQFDYIYLLDSFKIHPYYLRIKTFKNTFYILLGQP